MRKFLSRTIILAMLLSAVIFPNSVNTRAEGEISLGDADCGQTLSSATTYVLTEDMTCPDAGLIIGAANIIIDGSGHTITGPSSYYGSGVAGIDNSSGYDGITIANLTIKQYDLGVYFFGVQDSTVQNTVVEEFGTMGIYLVDSPYNSISGNTIEKTITPDSSGITLEGGSEYNNVANNYVTHALNVGYGIYLAANNNTIQGNRIHKNVRGMHGSGSNNEIHHNSFSYNSGEAILKDVSSANNSVHDNEFFNNKQDINDAGGNFVLANNRLNNDIISTMISINDFDRTRNLNDQITFSLTMKDLNNQACSDCEYNISTSPLESLNIVKDANTLNGSFNLTKVGVYSLIAQITDSAGNTTRRVYKIFSDDGSTMQPKTTKMYFRGINPTHVGPFGTNHDTRSFLLTEPSTQESGWCSVWVTFMIDELPPYPFANVTDLDSNFWYKSQGGGLQWSGVQRYSTYTNNEADGDTVNMPNVASYTWKNASFSNLNWMMDYTWNWYWLGFKFSATAPEIITLPDQGDADPTSWLAHSNDKSYVDLTYNYSTAPTVMSISDDRVNILSASADSVDHNNASIALDATGLDSDNDPANGVDNIGSTNITLEDHSRPFLNYPTIINSDGNAVLKAQNINSMQTINSANMEIVPNAGTIEVDIDTWNTSGTYYKKWTEAGSSVSSAGHTVGNLKANTYYTLKVDNNRFGSYKTDINGEISFTYTGGYSTKIFELQEDTSSSISSASVNPSAPNGKNGYYVGSTPTVTLSGSDDGSGINKIYYKWNDGLYQEYSTPFSSPEGKNTLYFYSTDQAGNSEEAASQLIDVDTISPHISLVEPNSDDFSTRSSRVTLKGSVDDITSGVSSLTVNGVNVPSPDSFFISLGLNYGLNTFTLVAADNAGLETRKSVIITREEAEYNIGVSPSPISKVVSNSSFIIDTKDGDKTVGLSEGQTPILYTQTPVFRGKTIPNATVELKIYSKTLEVTLQSDSDGNWEYKVTDPLEFGDHKISITVKDQSGKIVEDKSYNFKIAEKAEAKEVEKDGAKNTKEDNKALVYWLSLLGIIILSSVAYKLRSRKKQA